MIKDKKSCCCCFRGKRNTLGFFIIVFSSVIIVACLSLLIVLCQDTFPCHGCSTVASQTPEGLHQFWTLLLQYFSLLSFVRSFVVLCWCFITASATDLKECCLPSGVFNLNSFPTFGACTAKTFYYQRFPGRWELFLEGCRASHCVFLNHTSSGKYIVSKELYLNLSKYVDKLLVAKSLRVKPKESDWSVLF